MGGDMSTITAGNTVSTAITITGDTTGNLIFTTGGANATALTLDSNQVISFGGPVEEKVTVAAANATANVNFDAITQGVLLYTANASANTTINIRGNATIPLNNVLAIGQSISTVFMNPQGATPKYISATQIDGVGVTTLWQGGSAPTSGNANSTDVYVFTVIKTANAAYTVLGSQTQFK
jgi:hypothetical protein